jgi:hypothetical protein
MVTLPKDFVATKYPGYFWNLKEEKLYSLKVTGILRPMAGPYKPNPFNHWVTPGYQISVEGHKRSLHVDYLKKLKAVNSVIPMEKK